MQQYDEDHTLFAGGNAGDEKLFVKIENIMEVDKAETLAKGRVVNREVPHISIRAAGSKSFVCHKATLADRQRFPRHFAAFEQRKEMPVSGTLLSEWGLITRTMAKDLEAVEVRTIEQLIDMSDISAQSFMGMGELKKKAALFLQASSGAAPMNQLQEDLDSANMTIKTQQAMLMQMESRLNALESPQATVMPETMDEPTVALKSATTPRTRPSRAKK
jgi:hypothetical protein